MVAKGPDIFERFIEPPEPVRGGRRRVFGFTHAEALALVHQGIIPENASTELLNGIIVLKDRSACNQDPSMIGQDHGKCVERLSNLRSAVNNPSRHVESQQPLVCSPTHAPEPDFMVLRGTLEEYTDLPNASDVFCVVEVADSSYERDTGEKLAGYAGAGGRAIHRRQSSQPLCRTLCEAQLRHRDVQRITDHLRKRLFATESRAGRIFSDPPA